MNVLLEGAIESSIILIVTLAAMPLLRHRPAALRHGVLSAALACAVIAPVVGRIVPSWQLPIVLTSVAGDPARSGENRVPTGTSGASPADENYRTPGAVAPAAGFAFFAAVRSIWIAGFAVGVLILIAGLVQLTRVASGARRMESGPWIDLAEGISREYGLARPVALLLSAHPSLLVTWGLLRPEVVLPSAAASWPADRVRIVLYHELAHIRRRDWIVLLAAELLKCVYWFNPLVWMACARLRQESEHACDDAVINRGVVGTDYATHLVGIARDLKQQRHWLPAPAIARPSNLERRVRAMLDARLNRRPVSRASYAAILIAMLAITIPIASAQGGFASLTGSIVDPMNGVLPGVTLVLTNPQTQAKYEVRTDATGRYEFAALPAGDYLFEAKLPGFASFSGKVTVAAQNLQRDLTLDVGSLQETITVRASRTAPSGGRVDASRPALPKRPLPDCSSAAASTGLRVGGNIRPPHKLKDVRPVYPSHLASQGVEGTVVLSARIGTEGFVEEVSVVSAPHADLGQAVMDAVRLWEFDETLLNCRPVAVSMKVTVTFSLQP